MNLKSRSVNDFYFYFVFVGCILAGPLNAILFKILYTAYTQKYSFFVCQAINILYVINGGIALSYVKDDITDEMRQIPHRKFIVMGVLDFIGGLMCSMGAFYTSGAKQQLLNQALIPCTMFFSWLFLNKHSSLVQICGAFIIVVGSFIVILPELTSTTSIVSTDNANTTTHYMILLYNCIYALSNIPMSLSYVYKEYGFKNLTIHVLYLTQWVSVYQMLAGFVWLPLQMLLPNSDPNSTNITLYTLLVEFYYGMLCFLQVNIKYEYNSGECKDKSTFALLLLYCLLNFIYNTMGLYIVKHGGAILNSISYSIILPLTILTFSLSILGPFTEPTTSTTIIGLLITLIGFLLWRIETIFTIYSNQMEVPNTQAHRHMLVEHEMMDLECNTKTTTNSIDENSNLLNDKSFSTYDAMAYGQQPSHMNNSIMAPHDTVPDAFHERIICGFN